MPFVSKTRDQLCPDWSTGEPEPSSNTIWWLDPALSMLVQVTVSPALTAALAGEKPDEVTATAVTPFGPLVATERDQRQNRRDEENPAHSLAPRDECRTIRPRTTRFAP